MVDLLFTALLAFALAFTSYDMPEGGPPKVVFVSEIPGSFNGIYDMRSETIFIARGFQANLPNHQALLVHEFVHWLQHQSGRWGDPTCKLEREAYAVSDAYVFAFGLEPYMSPTRQRQETCEFPEEAR
ncbi:hypothetical protein LCGC14_1892310 [marine sediment metagenome]|uniref:DUF6647 domain-containing protein n=1 Tax=marine sediment metagenome TaxID=412755 RepID=A0A0F9FZ35_9ZZZZ